MTMASELGFTLQDFRIETTTPPDKRLACFRARKVLEEIVYDTVALENNPFTFPEVQTLMGGITVGGHRLEDERQVLNRAEVWRTTLQEVETGAFVPFTHSLGSALRLNGLLAKGQGLDGNKPGTGGAGTAEPSDGSPAPETLRSLYRPGARALGRVDCVHTQAIATFLFIARYHLFRSGSNKVTGHLLMNALLLSAGHDVITVPAKRLREFNTKVRRFYDTADSSEMVEFLAGCSMDRGLSITVNNGRLTTPPSDPAGAGDSTKPNDPVAPPSR